MLVKVFKPEVYAFNVRGQILAILDSRIAMSYIDENLFFSEEIIKIKLYP